MEIGFLIQKEFRLIANSLILLDREIELQSNFPQGDRMVIMQLWTYRQDACFFLRRCSDLRIFSICRFTHAFVDLSTVCCLGVWNLPLSWTCCPGGLPLESWPVKLYSNREYYISCGSSHPAPEIKRIHMWNAWLGHRKILDGY